MQEFALSDSRFTDDGAVLSGNTHTGAQHAGGEEIVRLVQRMFLANNEGGLRQVVFCGVGSKNGSSSVCASAGKTLAAISSRSVCLVDANLRGARLTDLLGVERAVAFPQKSGSVHERCIALSENLWLAGAGFLSGDGFGLPSADRLRMLLVELRETFDVVLMDVPGADVSGDAAILAQIADGTVLVIDAESTRRITARKVKESLEAAGIRLLGTVLSNRSFPVPKKLYDRL